MLIVFSQDFIQKFNNYILVYNKEDAGWKSELNIDNIQFIELSFNSFLTNLNIVINKLLLNWPVSFKYKLIFICENIILLYFIISNFKSDYEKNKYQTTTSILLVISIISLYIIFPNMLHCIDTLILSYFYIIFSKFKFNENYSLNK